MGASANADRFVSLCNPPKTSCSAGRASASFVRRSGKSFEFAELPPNMAA
jgi:hypothetical protein